jgi:hypothetical protein
MSIMSKHLRKGKKPVLATAIDSVRDEDGAIDLEGISTAIDKATEFVNGIADASPRLIDAVDRLFKREPTVHEFGSAVTQPDGDEPPSLNDAAERVNAIMRFKP